MATKEYICKYDHSALYFRDPEKTIRHRERGLPAWEWHHGDKSYWENDARHRLDGFAGDWKTHKAHFLNGKRLFRKLN